jgi:glucosamine-6-phosphate deaminase
VIIVKDYKELSLRAAALLKEAIKDKKRFALGLPSGETPLGTYKELVKLFKKGSLNFSSVVTFNLDEYKGLPKNSPNSFKRSMWDNLFGRINISKKKVHFPVGRGYDSEIKRIGGLDLILLGIGQNGHIAFNEPGSPFSSKTRTVTLSPKTRSDNSRFFEHRKDVPRSAVTVGIRTIMGSKALLLLASGKAKASAVKAALEGPVTSKVPASVIQKHKNATVLIDREAASKLKKEQGVKNGKGT